MTTRIPRLLVLLELVLLFVVGTGHSTTLVVQQRISVSRALAGHAYVQVSNSPADGITVELCSSDWKTVIASTKTDERGYFLLEKPATRGLFYLRLSAPGMDIYQLRVRIKKHAAKELAIYLSVAS